MKKLLSLFIFCFSLAAAAALSDRLQVEESIRNRLQDFLSAYDSQAKVTLNFDYKIYRETLPGTHLDSEDGTMPTKIESTDIKRVTVDIFSSQMEELPADVKSALIQLIPVRKSSISINFKKIEPQSQYISKNQVQVQDLNKVSKLWTETFTQVIYLTFAVLGLLGASLLTFLFLKRDKLIKQQMENLTKAITENAGGSQAQNFGYEDKHFNSEPSLAATNPQKESEINQLPLPALKELFADCYWSEKDDNAHWLWNQINPEIKSKLMTDLTFMKAYSSYFTTQKEQAFEDYKNPFYLQPVSCQHLSMPDLLAYIKKDLSRWHQLSPLRQANLALTLKEKISAVSSPNKLNFAWENITASKPRNLAQVIAPIYLTDEEEATVYENSQMIPSHLRESLVSLCWLALLENDELSKVLEKFDARALAEVWLGAPAVLQKLESSLPEKKLKALQSHRTRTPASKKSALYSTLAQLGARLYNQKQDHTTIKNEAA